MAAPSLALIETALLCAHEAADGPRLAGLYAEAADAIHAGGDEDAACFYLTQAFVFALEAGMPDAELYAVRLRELGRL